MIFSALRTEIQKAMKITNSTILKFHFFRTLTEGSKVHNMFKGGTTLTDVLFAPIPVDRT